MSPMEISLQAFQSLKTPPQFSEGVQALALKKKALAPRLATQRLILSATCLVVVTLGIFKTETARPRQDLAIADVYAHYLEPETLADIILTQ